MAVAGDRLFNRQVSLCLDVAGRRHRPAVPCASPKCYGGATRCFEWDAIRHAVEPSDAPGTGVVTRERCQAKRWPMATLFDPRDGDAYQRVWEANSFSPDRRQRHLHQK